MNYKITYINNAKIIKFFDSNKNIMNYEITYINNTKIIKFFDSNHKTLCSGLLKDQIFIHIWANSTKIDIIEDYLKDNVGIIISRDLAKIFNSVNYVVKISNKRLLLDLI